MSAIIQYVFTIINMQQLYIIITFPPSHSLASIHTVHATLSFILHDIKFLNLQTKAIMSTGTYSFCVHDHEHLLKLKDRTFLIHTCYHLYFCKLIVLWCSESLLEPQADSGNIVKYHQVHVDITLFAIKQLNYVHHS